MNLFSNFRQFFKEPPAIEPIQDKEKVDSMYSHWRMRIFYSCFIGYTIFYLCKKNIAVALPGLSEEFGFIGIGIVALLFLTLFYNVLKISINHHDLFGKYLSFGLAFMLIFQTLLNLSVVVGLVPITGITFVWEKIKKVRFSF